VKQESSASPKVDNQLDAVVVGAGFSGLYALYRLRDCVGLNVRVYEAGGGVGGTWYWNRYPGARCDVPSYSYSYSFSEELDQEWRWSEKCAPQPEIEQYLNHVTDRFDLRRNIRFNTRVISATYDEASRVWTIGTHDSGTDEHLRVQARFFIFAAGLLSTGNIPQYKGLDTFKGETYFTGAWPHEKVNFSGRRVGIIGTGSTGIQVIPVVAQEAAHLTVFQRTPNYSIPARNAPTDPRTEQEIKARRTIRRSGGRNGSLRLAFRTTGLRSRPWRSRRKSAGASTSGPGRRAVSDSLLTASRIS